MEDLLAGDVTADPAGAAAAAARVALTHCLRQRAAAAFGASAPSELYARGFAPPFAQPPSNVPPEYALGGACTDNPTCAHSFCR